MSMQFTCISSLHNTSISQSLYLRTVSLSISEKDILYPNLYLFLYCNLVVEILWSCYIKAPSALINIDSQMAVPLPGERMVLQPKSVILTTMRLSTTQLVDFSRPWTTMLLV